jgi:hypothetical protein
MQASPQEYFRMLLMTVVSTAYGAAGYTLQDSPAEHAGGLLRFATRFESGAYTGMFAFIEYQVLAYADTAYSAGVPSRFRVTLIRSDQPYANVNSTHASATRRDLSALVVEDFKVAILPSGRHWWTYNTVNDLGKALTEAAHLVIGFGLPWLSGDLTV